MCCSLKTSFFPSTLFKGKSFFFRWIHLHHLSCWDCGIEKKHDDSATGKTKKKFCSKRWVVTKRKIYKFMIVLKSCIFAISASGLNLLNRMCYECVCVRFFFAVYIPRTNQYGTHFLSVLSSMSHGIQCHLLWYECHVNLDFHLIFSISLRIFHFYPSICFEYLL